MARDEDQEKAVGKTPNYRAFTKIEYYKGIDMSLVKKYLKSKPVCKVTFRLPQAVADRTFNASLLGDFNEWNPQATPMKKLKSGDFTVTLDLARNREYQFRYLMDGTRWENDEQADRYDATPFGDSENSVIIV